MKKLMIAAAIVCAAVMAQAAGAKWTINASNIYKSGGSETTDKLTTKAFFFDGTVGTMQSVYNAFIANQAVDLTGVEGYLGQANITEGTMNNLAAEFGTVGATYSKLYFAVVNGDEMYFSQELPGVGGEVAQTLAYGAQGKDKSKLAALESNTATMQRWNTPAAVPEPTSGLLLLLGVAGMALRRRRA